MRLSPALFVATALVVAMGTWLVIREPTPPAPATIAAPASVPERTTAAPLAPHPQRVLPSLPLDSYPLARPPEVTAAVYRFAAEHPEVLSYVPCYCGCERQGHRGNEDCFVADRGPNGDVTGWEPHGLT